MKHVIRILAGCIVLTAIGVAWKWHAISAMSGLTLDRVANDVFNATFFKIGNLPVTPLFVIKVVVYVVLLMLAAHLGRRILRERILTRTSLDEGLRYAVAAGVSYAIFFFGAVIGLQSLGLDLSSVAFLGGAVGLGIGVGLQAVVNNFVSGIILLVERPIKVGDRVEIENLNGDVVKIAARSTWVCTNDNVVIIVPNSEFTTQRVTNWTANDRSVRLSLPVGTSYASDPVQVRALLLDVAARHPDVLADPAPDVIFTDFGDSSLDFELRVWTTNQVRTPQILKSDLYFAIFDLFKREDIELPFPQRDLHLRSAIPLTLAREGA
ncbi:MAG TPA: mechanosensitive ion channel domain-containing protein [Terracidiphilus sp.]|nr:mechanosensitive ion channel domain-containing protein [Terracidiphilus sp.]